MMPRRIRSWIKRSSSGNSVPCGECECRTEESGMVVRCLRANFVLLIVLFVLPAVLLCDQDTKIKRSSSGNSVPCGECECRTEESGMVVRCLGANFVLLIDWCLIIAVVL